MRTSILSLLSAFLLVLLCCTACSTNNENNTVSIYDRCNILSRETEMKIHNMNFRVKNTIIVTLDSIDIQHLSDETNKLFKFYEFIDDYKHNGILILTVRRPNISIIKFGDSFDGVGLLPVNYGSERYYRLQCDENLTAEEKTLALADIALEASQNYTDLVNVIRGELLGNLFNLVEPGNGFFYNYLIRPFQYPVILLLRVTGNFVVSLILWAVILLTIGILIISYSMKEKFSFLHLKPGKIEFNKAKVTMFFNLISLLIWDIPMIVGCMGISSNFSQVGLEKVFIYAENMGLSPRTVNSIFLSGGSNFSYFISFLALTVVLFATYRHPASKSTIFKASLWGFLCCFSPISVVFAILIYHLPLIYFNYRFLKLDIYDKSRKAGLGHVESLFYTVVGPLTIAFSSVIAVVLINVLFKNNIQYISPVSKEFKNEISESRINQLFPVKSTDGSENISVGAELSNLSQFMEIIEPLHLVSTYTEGGFFKYKTYEMKINCHKTLFDVPLIFKSTYDKHNSFDVEWLDIINEGESVLTFKIFNRDRDLIEPFRIGIKDSNLSKYIVVTPNNNVENTTDFPICFRYEFKLGNRKVQSMIVLESKSRLNIKRDRDFKIIDYFR